MSLPDSADTHRLPRSVLQAIMICEKAKYESDICRHNDILLMPMLDHHTHDATSSFRWRS
jgi:hypothetical protein